MTKPKQNLVGCRVKIGDEFGIVTSYFSSPTYSVQRDDGTTTHVKSGLVKRLSRNEEVEFWRQRALAAEGITPVEENQPISRTDYNASVRATDTGFVATCACGTTTSIPADTHKEVLSELEDDGWTIDALGALCPSCSE